MKKAKPPESETPKVDLEKERRILLDLGHDLTRVRDKSDEKMAWMLRAHLK